MVRNSKLFQSVFLIVSFILIVTGLLITFLAQNQRLLELGPDIFGAGLASGIPILILLLIDIIGGRN